MRINLKNFILEKSTDDPNLVFEDIVDDWIITNYTVIENYRDIRMRCLCGTSPLKYCYTIKNVKNGVELEPVGSKCIEKVFPELHKNRAYYEQKYYWETEGILGDYICNVCFQNRQGSIYEKVCMNKCCIDTYFKRVNHTQLINILNDLYTKDLGKNIVILQDNMRKKKIINNLKRQRIEYENKLYADRLEKLLVILNKRQKMERKVVFTKWKDIKTTYRYDKACKKIKSVDDAVTKKLVFGIFKNNVKILKEESKLIDSFQSMY